MLPEQARTAIIALGRKEAEEGVNAGHGGPFGAVVFESASGRVISSGHNRVLANNDPSAHAEIIAVRKACALLKTPHLTGCSVYATGQPCPMCLAALHWARLDACLYSTSYEDASRIGFDDAPIRDSLTGAGPSLLRVGTWPDEDLRRFFLSYAGKMY